MDQLPSAHALWTVVVVVWNFIMWPTTWGFPFGTIFQLVYLYVAYRLYIRYMPEFIQAFVRKRLKPLVQRGVDEIRDMVGGMIQTKRDERPQDDGEQRVVERCTWRKLFYVFVAGAMTVILWQYVMWPLYIRPTFPF